MSKVKKFIPLQKTKVDRLYSCLCSMQLQLDRMAQCKKELEEFDSWPIGVSHYQTVDAREAIVSKHDKHVTIYNNILDHYQTVLCAMSANVIMHICGAHPYLPSEQYLTAPTLTLSVNNRLNASSFTQHKLTA